MTAKHAQTDSLAMLRNVGPAAIADFKLLGIATIDQLVTENADELYLRLCTHTRVRHDPCVHDVFSAAIHQAKTGEALNWWAFSSERKRRQAVGEFPQIPI